MRRMTMWLGLALALSCAWACKGKGSGGDGGSDGSETGSTDDGSESSGGSDTDECPMGDEGCPCNVLGECGEGLECIDGICQVSVCEDGTEGCPCVGGTTCDDGLKCEGQTCVPVQPCQYENDLECDEPEGTGYCDEGTDVDDCCPTPQDGNCEEMSQGGACPDNGADFYDCGYCPDPWQGDWWCDDPMGLGLCPADSDPLDCCGYHDGQCGEMSMGGECPNGSDYYDCGYCPDDFMGDGYCDEPEGEDLCPEGTDPIDC